MFGDVGLRCANPTYGVTVAMFFITACTRKIYALACFHHYFWATCHRTAWAERKVAR
jgi:hypothetical protein